MITQLIVRRTRADSGLQTLSSLLFLFHILIPTEQTIRQDSYDWGHTHCPKSLYAGQESDEPHWVTLETLLSELAQSPLFSCPKRQSLWGKSVKYGVEKARKPSMWGRSVWSATSIAVKKSVDKFWKMFISTYNEHLPILFTPPLCHPCMLQKRVSGTVCQNPWQEP